MATDFKPALRWAEMYLTYTTFREVALFPSSHMVIRIKQRLRVPARLCII